MSPATVLPLASKAPVTEKLVFVDGIPRSGKKLTCKIISHLQGVEFFQYASIIENTAYAQHLGHMDLQAAARFIQVAIDEVIYNRAIGRNLNTRPSDETYVFKHFEADLYVARSQADDGMVAMEKFNANKRISLFHTHSLLGLVDVLFAAFPYLKLVHVTRHPVDIAEEWFSRGMGVRWETDPLVFSIATESTAGPVPWYAAEWPDIYQAMTPAERCVESVIRHQERDQNKLKALGTLHRKCILQIALEHLIADTHRIVADIAAFIPAMQHSHMAAFLVEENCPASLPLEQRRKNMKTLARDCSDAVIERLMDCAENYENDWGLEPLHP